MQRHEAHAARGVARETERRHVRRDVASVFDIRRLAVGRIGARDVVMVSPEHHRADLPVAHHLVELERDADAPLRVLIEDAALRADDELVLLGVAYPGPVVPVLEAPVRVYALHRRHIGPVQILRVPRKAAPAEWAVAVIEEQRSHDVFDVAREDEAVVRIHAVLRHLFDAGVVDRAQEGVAVVEEVAAAADKELYQLKVSSERHINELPEFFRFFFKKPRALLKCDADGAVAAVVGGVAACLVREQVYGNIVVDGILEQVDDVAVEGDRIDFALGHFLFRHRESLFRRLGDPPDPALSMAGLNTRPVYLGGDRNAAGDVGRLRLRAAHAAEPGCDVEASLQTLAALAKFHTPSVEDCVIGAVNDALRPDVHPAAGRHLPVVGDAELHRAVPLLLIVEEADHQAVGEHYARCIGGRSEKSERVSRFNDERLIRSQHFKIFFYQKILHPVLTDLPRLAVGNELIGVECDVKVEVVVDHYLKGLSLYAIALILVNRLAVELSGGAEAIAVNASASPQLCKEFGGDLRVIFLRDVAQRVLQREHRLLFIQSVNAVRRAAVPRVEFLLRRQPAGKFQPYLHSVFKRFVVHHLYFLLKI